MCVNKMPDNTKGLVGQIYNASESAGSVSPMASHFIISQQALCGMSLDISCAVDPVVSTVNFIRSHGLIHRQFLPEM